MAEDSRDEADRSRDAANASGDGDRSRDDADDRYHEPAAVDEATGDLALPDPLLEILANPTEGPNRLPYLLGLLDGPDPRERLTAATAVCLVVESHPDLVAYAVGRLVDRLDDDAPVEVAHALDYLAARRPRDVDEAVADLDDAAERRARRRMYRTGGGFARSEYLSPTEGDRTVGRTRVASGASEDPRRIYTEDGDADRDRRADGEDPDDASDGSDGPGSDDPDDRAGVGDAGSRGVTSGTLQLVSKRLSAVIQRSRFDDLSVLDERRRGRYGDVCRTAGTVDGEQRAVALTVYRLPDDRTGFVDGFRAAMADWSEVDDHETVLPVYDWGARPRPWATVEYADVTLAAREDDPRDPLWTALQLTEAVGYAHQHGVVHGAVDPGNVVYRDDVLTDDERRRPLLSNVALAAATGIDRPGRGVDPRYAAPEHYDDRFGRVDHATDVYGLGAVLFRLCTGKHPYDGDPADVRERVLGDGTLTPTDVDADLPGNIDRVVRKATATRKLTRYETVTNLARELRTTRDGG
jgi:hypothetical protein